MDEQSGMFEQSNQDGQDNGDYAQRDSRDRCVRDRGSTRWGAVWC